MRRLPWGRHLSYLAWCPTKAQFKWVPASLADVKKAKSDSAARSRLQREKRKREVEDADGAMAAEMIAPAAQEHGSDLQTVWQYIGQLPALQREALLLVGAQGLTYEAAAEVMGCEVGTAKSRVSRARALLAEKLGIVGDRTLA